MGHDHGHPHPTPSGPGALRRMLIALSILTTFLVIEVVVAVAIGSLALLADAGHILTDLVALAMGAFALLLARRPPTVRRTFGWHRAEVLTTVFNAVLLIALAIYIVVEAINRVGEPTEIPGSWLIIVAAIGLLANGVVIMMLRSSAGDSLAVRSAYLEVLADAISSVGVIIAGIVLLTTGWMYVDLVVAIAISLWVVPRAILLGLSALRILTEQSPKSVDVAAIERELRQIDGVLDVHDLHVWSLTIGMDAATVHLTTTANAPAALGSSVLGSARVVLGAHRLEHATIQVEQQGQQGQCSELSW
ncbi:MAG: cation diffusion facilitator family transporter [Antricoccus sp.]